MNALDRAIAVMGSQARLAKAIGVRTQAISYWKSHGGVPVERCADIHRVTRGRVSFSDMCPEIAALVLESLATRQIGLFDAPANTHFARNTPPMEAAMT